MNATSSSTDYILPLEVPPSRSPSLTVNHTFDNPFSPGRGKNVGFFDLVDDQPPEPAYDTNRLYPSQTRDTIGDVFTSGIGALSGAPVASSTETDVSSSLGQTHFGKTKDLSRLGYEDPSTIINATSERPTGPDAAHCYDLNSLISSIIHTFEPSASQVTLLPRNNRLQQLHMGLFYLKQKLSDSMMVLPGPYLLWCSVLAILLYSIRVPGSASKRPCTTAVCLVSLCLFLAFRDVLHSLRGLELYSHPDSQRNTRRKSQAQLEPYYTELWSSQIIGDVEGAILAAKAELGFLVQNQLWLSTVSNTKYITTDKGLMKRSLDHVIPGLLDSKRTVEATGDTGAKYNFLNEDYAKRCKFKIDSTSRRLITIASGQKIMTAGITEVSFCFRGERTPHLLKFHILPGCVKNVILGKSFLRATKTFSNALHFAKRVVKRFTRTLNKHEVLFLGASPPMFTGLLNGETKTALADSASKVLIMDEDYARTLGLSIVSMNKTCIKLRFADGSTAFTSGKTYNVSWQFGTGKRFPLDFYILKNAPADVILSEDFLLRETKAFIEYADCLMEEDDGDVGYYDDSDDDDFFFAIYRDENYHPQAYTEGADEYFEDDREDTRRTEEDLYIASLIGDEKDAAIARAKERRAQWAAKQAANSLAQGGQNNTTNTASPSAAPQLQTINAAGVPSSSKRHRWRFKLMKKRKARPTGQNP